MTLSWTRTSGQTEPDQNLVLMMVREEEFSKRNQQKLLPPQIKPTHIFQVPPELDLIGCCRVEGHGFVDNTN